MFDNEGGKLIEQLINIVEHDDDIEISLDAEEIQSLAVALLTADNYLDSSKTVNAALNEPINDPDSKDPQTVQEAEHSIYWTEWLAAMYEELESLKAKGVYEEVDELPPGQKAIDCKWVLHIVFKGPVQSGFFSPIWTNHNHNRLPIMVIPPKIGLNHKKPVQSGSMQFKLQFSHNQFELTKTDLLIVFST
jgi:hypothetical protein